MKSSFCSAGGCVDVEFNELAGMVIVADDIDGVTVFTFDQWNAFIKGVKNGEFDLPEEG